MCRTGKQSSSVGVNKLFPASHPDEARFMPLMEEGGTPGSEDDPDEGTNKQLTDTGGPSRSDGMLAELMGGALTTVVTLVLNVTYAGVVMGGSPLFLPYLSYGIAMCLGCTALSNLWLLVTRRSTPFITVADSFMAVLFSAAATNIERDIAAKQAAPDSGQLPESPLGTLALSMAVTSAMLAAAYVAIGSARVCNIVQFVPSPVMAGYQASIGFLLLDSASTLASGHNLIDVQAIWSSPAALMQLVAASVTGIGMFVVQQHTEGIPRILVIPGVLLVATLLFQGAMLVMGAAAADQLTLYALNVPEGNGLPSFFADVVAAPISWQLGLKQAIITTATSLVPNLLGKLLQFSAIEELYDADIDYNTEMRHAGWSQIFSTPAMMLPTTTFLGMRVAYDMGARSFVPPTMVVVGNTLLLVSGSYLVTLVPRAMFAALLVTSGLNLLSDNLRTAYSTLHPREFFLVVVHIGLTATLGMLAAVVLGMLFTATIFIVQYSSHSGVLQVATSQLERSKVARPIAEQDVLEQYGASVLIIHLHGMIFFGSASSVVEEVKAHLATLSELNLPLRFLLLDFDRCAAIDSSAVSVLFSTRRQIKDASLIFACAGTEILQMLSKGKGDADEFEHYTTLDLALEHCENAILFDAPQEELQVLNPPSPVMLKNPMAAAKASGLGGGGLPSALTSALRTELLKEDGSLAPSLRPIDECTATVYSEEPSTDPNSTENEDTYGLGNEAKSRRSRPGAPSSHSSFESLDQAPAIIAAAGLSRERREQRADADATREEWRDDAKREDAKREEPRREESKREDAKRDAKREERRSDERRDERRERRSDERRERRSDERRDERREGTVHGHAAVRRKASKKMKRLRAAGASAGADDPLERLPNPFTGCGTCVQSLAHHSHSSLGAGPSTSSANAAAGAYGLGGGGSDGASGTSHILGGALRAGLGSGDADEGASSDSSSTVAMQGDGATIYSPEQARAELLPEALEKMRDRFAENMRTSYGAKDLDDIFPFFDIVLIPPNYTVVSSTSALEAQTPFLYVLDRGHVSAYAMLGGDPASIQPPQAAQPADASAASTDVGAALAQALARDKSSSDPRHRLAKYGPGAILGVAAFVTPDDMPSLNIMPTAAVSDTYCQLLRLPRSRCDELESLKPALVFRLYRLLVLISERRLQDHRMRVVASEAFKINVRPSTNFQRMLASGSLSTSRDELPQFPPNAAATTAALASAPTPAAGAPVADTGARSERAVGGGDSDTGGGGGLWGASGAGGSISVVRRGGEAHHTSGAGGPIYQALQESRLTSGWHHPLAAADATSSAPSKEVSPNATPMATPVLDRRTDNFVGPTLNLFSQPQRDPPVPPSQLFPGREALPVASMASFQSAMLEEMNAQAVDVGAPHATNTEHASENDATSSGVASGVSSFLWPRDARRDNQSDTSTALGSRIKGWFEPRRG